MELTDTKVNFKKCTTVLGFCRSGHAYKFGKSDQVVVLEIQEVEISNFFLPVNNSVPCIFLGRWHMTVCLDIAWNIKLWLYMCEV